MPYTEIQAYDALYRLNITPFEVDMLRMLDGVWQKAQPEPKKGK